MRKLLPASHRHWKLLPTGRIARGTKPALSTLVHLHVSLSLDLFKFALLFSTLYAAFGVASPFLPELLSLHGADPERLGLTLSLATTIRLISAPLAGRIADRFHALRIVLAICAALGGAAALVFLPAVGFPVLLLAALLHAATLAPTTVLADALALSAATTSSPTRFRFEYGWVRGLGVARIHFGLSDDRADHPGLTKIDAKLEATAIVRRSAPRPQCARSRFRARLQRSPNRRTVSRYWWCDQVGCPTDSPAPSCNMDFGAGPLGDLGVIQGGSDRRAIDALRFVRRLITVNVRCALQSDCRRLSQRFVAKGRHKPTSFTKGLNDTFGNA
jgi:MFS_1 like family